MGIIHLALRLKLGQSPPISKGLVQGAVARQSVVYG
jgi:hypothetical protein